MAYPDSPGWKAEDPSHDAAKAITRHAKNLRDRVHGFLQDQYPSAYSADQIAARLPFWLPTSLCARIRHSVTHGSNSGLSPPVRDSGLVPSTS